MVWLGKIFGYVVQFFYGWFNNYGFAIIMFTIVTRILMFPLTIKQQKTAAANARLQPKMNELRARYGNDQKAYSDAMQELYAKENVSPSAGCLPLLIQLPLFFGMYTAIQRPLECVLHISTDKIDKLCKLFNLATDKKGNYTGYYQVELLRKIRDGVGGVFTSGSDVIASASDAVSNSSVLTTASDVVASATDIVSSGDVAAILGGDIDRVQHMANSFRFLGFDLLQTAAFWNAALILAVLVFVAQVASMILTNKMNKIQSTPGQGCSPNVMAVSMGLFSLWISFTIPSAFVLYWLASSLIAPLQTWVTMKFFGPVVMNAKAEAQRNATLAINEQKIIDEVTRTKGSIELKPSEPVDEGSQKKKRK